MTRPSLSRCPGSGMTMVPHTFVMRRIEEMDREQNAVRIARATHRGDLEEAEIIRTEFQKWELEQGSSYERLACPVCGDAWLTPTKKGTSRPHTRRETHRGWDSVRQLRADIKTLETELDRILESLEHDPTLEPAAQPT